MLKQQRMTRRECLGRTAAWTAAGWAAPYFIPARVLAGPGRPGANDRVGVAYIGAGRRARQLMHLPPDATMVAVCDVLRPRAEEIAAQHGCLASDDYRQLLDRKDVDAVVVATPDHWHALASLHACQAGKDVYCEKPLTLTIHEGRRLVEAARKYERVFQTGSQQRSMAANRIACELVRRGRFGKIHRVVGHNYPSPWECDFPAQKVPTGLDWDRWCGPTEPRPYHEDLFRPRAKPGWISFRPFSGGEMTGWGAHGLDQIQWALGMDASGPVEVGVSGPKMVPPTYSVPASQQEGIAACSHPTVYFRYPVPPEVGSHDKPIEKTNFFPRTIEVKLGDGPPGGAIFLGDAGQITIGRGRFTVEPEELSREILAEVGPIPDGEDHLQKWIAS
ncbi:MAG: Gfo/Idh/MocA family protein, partial [Pirellulales bacterium]